jgi:transposase
MRKKSASIHLTPAARTALNEIIRKTTSPARLVQRARIVLLAAEGINQREIARRLNCHYNSIGKWLARWMLGGIDVIDDRKRSGRPAEWTPAEIKIVVNQVCKEPPPYLSRWSVRTLAAYLHVPPTTVFKILEEHDLHPHRIRTFTFSPDPQFEDKLLDVVGLYMNPPENAVVLCVDEKTGIQALDRTQPMLPIVPGNSRAWTNEYVRHGTRTMLASLDISTGEVFAHIKNRRTSVIFLEFMEELAEKYQGQRLCVVMDNLNTHNNAAAKEWLSRHPQITFHYTPKHASWTNLIECFFSILIKQGLQQAVHKSGRQLTIFLKSFVREYNKRCGPFVWTKGPEKLRKIIQLTKKYQKYHM